MSLGLFHHPQIRQGTLQGNLPLIPRQMIGATPTLLPPLKETAIVINLSRHGKFPNSSKAMTVSEKSLQLFVRTLALGRTISIPYSKGKKKDPLGEAFHKKRHV